MSRPSPASARAQLVDIIGNSVYHALGLKESLEEERAALESQDMDALHSAVENKSVCVKKLHDLDGQRVALCQLSGFGDGPDQMQALIDWCDDSDLVSNRWDNLMILAAESSALNMTKGAIIRLRQQQFESSLSVLRGAPTRPATYSRTGAAPGNLGQSSLAQA
ncbi:MAG: flagella synthesis protein FlgN [Gammaproteobacteria bacterium]